MVSVCYLVMLEFQYEFYIPEPLTEAGEEASTEKEWDEDKENTDRPPSSLFGPYWENIGRVPFFAGLWISPELSLVQQHLFIT